MLPVNWDDKLVENAPDEAIAHRVVAAVRSLLALDKHLLEVNASERSISHRLALHLTKQFEDMDVDCEYNRNGHEIKRLQIFQPCVSTTGDEGSPVYPDIIVHRRFLDENALVIEIKKSTSSVSDEWDLAKLSAFRNELGYKTALFLRFECNVETPTLSHSQWVDG